VKIHRQICPQIATHEQSIAFLTVPSILPAAHSNIKQVFTWFKSAEISRYSIIVEKRELPPNSYIMSSLILPAGGGISA